MSNNIFAPLEVRAMFLTASEFSISNEPAENMSISMSISLNDEEQDYDEELGAHLLEQELTVLARLVDQEGEEDERMRASATIHIASRCKAAKDEPTVMEYMRGSNVSIAYGHARSFIATVTALSPMGQFLIPAVDPEALLVDLRGD